MDIEITINKWEEGTFYKKGTILIFDSDCFAKTPFSYTGDKIDTTLYVVRHDHTTSITSYPKKDSFIYTAMDTDYFKATDFKKIMMKIKTTPKVKLPKVVKPSKVVLSKEAKELQLYRKKHCPIKVTLEQKILNLDIPMDVKHDIYSTWEESNKSYGLSGPDSSKLSWLDHVCNLPFNRRKALNVGQEVKFLENVKKQLDHHIYGMEDVKQHLLGHVSKMITVGNTGGVLALQGVAGVGKTILLKHGLQKALNLPFFQINCGGMKDGSVLVGHSKTYKDSKYGLIADIMIKAGCNNPIIYLDEIDKVSKNVNEITGILIHMLDPEQNMDFHDDYFDNIPIDLSNVTFVLSFNNVNDIDPILRDRLNIISVPTPCKLEKLIILKEKILPKLLAQMKMVLYNERERRSNELVVKITDDILEKIVKDTSKDGAGVRDLKHYLELLLNNVNKMRIMTGEKYITVTREMLELCKKEEKKEDYNMMYL